MLDDGRVLLLLLEGGELLALERGSEVALSSIDGGAILYKYNMYTLKICGCKVENTELKYNNKRLTYQILHYKYWELLWVPSFQF